MKISVNWLRELVSVEATWEELARRLTAAGLEVEAATPFGADGVAGVIAVEVRGARRHPRADNLHLVDVFDGREVVQVVCGAPTLPPVGARVPWARPGSRLPGGREIAAKEIRGVTSPGMLCAEDELGLGARHEGLLVLDRDLAPGADVAAALGPSDVVLDLNVTPNRPDCLGHLGVAREIAALFADARLHPPESRTGPLAGGPPIAGLARVTLEDPDGCGRYVARVLVDVTVGESRLAARRRLESLGVRAISDVVDATNLVLLEIGHPLHAFDLDKLEGGAIVVRRARPGETLVTLDGVERRLDPEDVVIADAARAVAVAGVMGGQSTEVGAQTRRILLESAWFEPSRVRRTARRLGLHTEASHRFERGADPNAGTTRASARCVRLLTAATGGRLAAGVIDVYPRPRDPRAVTLRPSRTSQILGVVLPPTDQARLLAGLELEPTLVETPGADDAIITCQVPTFRPDLTREIDLIEEVARLYGYDRIPATLPRPSDAPPAPPADLGETVRDALRALGLHETISFGFTGPGALARLRFPATDRRAHPLRLANPLREEQSAMRTSLLPGLLGALEDNLARGVADVRLFEVGTVFLAAAASDEVLPEEHTEAAAVLAGSRDGWLKAAGELDFYDVKGLLEAICAHLQLGAVSFRAAAPGEVPWLHPGVAAVMLVGGTLCGRLGELHPEVRHELGVQARAFALELDLAAVHRAAAPGAEGAAPPRAFAEPPRFPGSSRDISFFVDAAVPAGDLQLVIAGASPLIESVAVLEDYREPGKVPAGRKGMLWSVAYRAADRTVTDGEVSREHERVLGALAERFSITPR